MYRPNGLDIDLYLRKSRKDIEEEKKAEVRGEEYDTLSRHRNQLLALAIRENHNILQIHEEVVSGESVSERPEIQKLLRRIESGKIEAVLVVDIDRLGRGDMLDQGILDRAFRYSGTKLITTTEYYDPEDESWELVFGIKSLVSRQELKAITRRLQSGRRESAKEGKSISKKPPYGYLRTENLVLYPNPETAWVVKKMFTMMKDGFGRNAIAEELDRLEISPPDPTKRKTWSPSTITAIIKNEVYLGHIIWGKIKHTKRGGKYIKKKVPSDKWHIKQNAHEPIVSQELFDAANRAHTGRWRPSTVETKALSNPLAGILKCEVCGYTMWLQPRKDRPNPLIRCPQPQCKGIQKGALAPLVEERVLKGLEEIIKQHEFTQTLEQTRDNSVIPLKIKAIQKKQKELDELLKQKSNLHDLLERGVYDINTFMERQQIVVDRMKIFEEEIKNLKEEIQIEELKDKNINEFIPKVKTVLEAYHKTNDIEKKNRLLKSILDKATYLRKKEWTTKDQFIIQLYPKI
ncbi:recombinase family protein [Neobacillus sp. PS3-40]|uniref:recombinase family protein n=1 Tax=Neobacillus sp. PS3-40 TaxID=3070679 RepID=UPI0027DEE96F|nr:recombinase family protein [Neobacillus sp. PS3-40]WML43110.1 recombinase family protein [Neobacillus sp. PS3-40]